jgi:hypothetical protein
MVSGWKRLDMSCLHRSRNKLCLIFFLAVTAYFMLRFIAVVVVALMMINTIMYTHFHFLFDMWPEFAYTPECVNETEEQLRLGGEITC